MLAQIKQNMAEQPGMIFWWLHWTQLVFILGGSLLIGLVVFMMILLPFRAGSDE